MSTADRANKRSGGFYPSEKFAKINEEGVEVESIEFSEKITEPFDPNLINISTRTFTVDLILKRIAMGELNLTPDFQRHEIWSTGAQSRLIESLLIRIPLPAFYIDATEEDTWLVVDGLQRLSTLRNFVSDKSLRLTELEFLGEQLDGKTFDQLPRNMQRRILETQITVYLIERDTQPEVKFNIFKRINTGGLPLSAQEIRHALFQGNATRLLTALAESDEFKRATDYGVNPKRMGDRECILRFLAFSLEPPEAYSSKDLDSYLNTAMVKLNKKSSSELSELRSLFFRAMDVAYKCFKEYAFRKRYGSDETYRYPINKALFETWSVNIARLTKPQQQVLISKRHELRNKFSKLMATDRDFETAISFGTGDPAKVKLRFGAVKTIIGETLSD